jgi:F-box/leucine-rich repeat protein 7
LDLLDRLRLFPLFQAAPDSFLAAIGTFLRPQLHSPNDEILREGDDAKAMYWLVRGGLKVTSRDGESTYAELKPGAFFGEIGILMDMPRTANVTAKLKSLVIRLNKEDLQKVLPDYPDVERAIRDEATERLTILQRKKKEISQNKLRSSSTTLTRVGKRPREGSDGDVEMGEAGMLRDGEVISSLKKRKSPSPSLADALATSALGSPAVNVRQLLKELPLFTSLPPEILHFIGLNAQPVTYPPFTEIIKQGDSGRDVFFIVRGEVEVLIERPVKVNGNLTVPGARQRMEVIFKKRLKSGQYFGEITSLSLAPRRTATVRSVNSADCLIITGDVLDELWRRCSPDLRRQVEQTARQRRAVTSDTDVEMADVDTTPAIGELDLEDLRPRSPQRTHLPSVSFAADAAGGLEDKSVESCDPDPLLNLDLENVRSRSRRGSLAPPSPSTVTPPPEKQTDEEAQRSPRVNGVRQAPSPLSKSTPPSPRKSHFAIKRPRLGQRRTRDSLGALPDNILVLIFQHLDVYELMKLRPVSLTWMKLLTTNHDILHTLDLRPYNKYVTDKVVMDIICPFLAERPQYIDISNCFHLTDEGFMTLAGACGPNVKIWRMKSVWDITGQAVLEMVNKAKGLEEIDLSNCRKVGDNLLARVIGWVVPEVTAAVQQQSQQIANRRFGQKNPPQQQQQQQQQQAAPGTVIGCPQLKHLTLSYCKHITDKSMAHIAVHASARLEEMDLTRCTTITDLGFQHWSIYPFPKLQKLCLADCTYLTDNAIVALTNAAKGLKELDLVSIFLPSLGLSCANKFPSHSAAHSRIRRQKSSLYSVLTSHTSTWHSVALLCPTAV